jgi:serine/threonine protein kinase
MQSGNLIGGRYRLARRVGAGNMGVVFEVEDQQTGRRVALKQVLYGGKEHQQRLLREARVCQRLKHPNIIEVLDVGVTEAGAPFLVMPLLTGETIGELLKRKRRVAPMLAAQVGRDIASALAVAHAEGIIHRDLKPANVFIHRPGKAEKPIIKVLDFGVCKDVNSRLTELTSAGNVVGTPAYMSPEQLKGVELDARTDVWSLGVVLFEMLTGVRPFRGEGVELFLKILSGEVPTVSRLVRSMPVGLADIVSRCLTRDREQRIGSAAELASQLDDLVREGMVVSTTSAPEPGVGTSSGMATHLGSQTVSGALLVEAGASATSLSSLESASSAAAPSSPPRIVVASETLRSAPLPEGQALSGSLSNAKEAGIAAIGHSAAAAGSAAMGGSDVASVGMTFSSLLDEDEALLAAGPEQPGGMSLEGEVLEGVSHRAVLAMISAAALACALLGVGTYAVVTETSKRAAAQAAGISETPVLPQQLSQADNGNKEEQAAGAALTAGSSAEEKSAPDTPQRSLQAPLQPAKPPQARVQAQPPISYRQSIPLQQGAPRSSQAKGATSTLQVQPTSSSRAASPAVSGWQAKSNPAAKGASNTKSPGASSAKACGGTVAKRCIDFSESARF